jgi:hypothetical protein
MYAKFVRQWIRANSDNLHADRRTILKLTSKNCIVDGTRVPQNDDWHAHVNTVLNQELEGFGIVSIVRYSKKPETTTFWESSICFRPKVKGWETPTVFGMLGRANINHWTNLFHHNYSYINA